MTKEQRLIDLIETWFTLHPWDMMKRGKQKQGVEVI